MTQTAAAVAAEMAREARLLDDPHADDPQFDSDFYEDV